MFVVMSTYLLSLSNHNLLTPATQGWKKLGFLENVFRLWTDELTTTQNFV